jgi:quercetin dioxygenase-like cupin family protein
MTELIKWRPEPGPDGYQQPKKKVVWLDDAEFTDIATRSTHPNDKGRSQYLVHPRINGSPDVEFWFGVYRLDPGEYHPRHYHPGGAEFYYVISGTGDFHVDDEIIHASPGCCMYFPPGTVHSALGTGDKTMELVYGFSIPDYDRVGCIWVE